MNVWNMKNTLRSQLFIICMYHFPVIAKHLPKPYVMFHFSLWYVVKTILMIFFTHKLHSSIIYENSLNSHKSEAYSYKFSKLFPVLCENQRSAFINSPNFFFVIFEVYFHRFPKLFCIVWESEVCLHNSTQTFFL